MVSSTGDYAVFCQMMLNRGIYNNQRLPARNRRRHALSESEDTRGAYGYGDVDIPPLTTAVQMARRLD